MKDEIIKFIKVNLSSLSFLTGTPLAKIYEQDIKIIANMIILKEKNNDLVIKGKVINLSPPDSIEYILKCALINLEIKSKYSRYSDVIETDIKSYSEVFEKRLNVRYRSKLTKELKSLPVAVKHCRSIVSNVVKELSNNCDRSMVIELINSLNLSIRRLNYRFKSTGLYLTEKKVNEASISRFIESHMGCFLIDLIVILQVILSIREDVRSPKLKLFYRDVYFWWQSRSIDILKGSVGDSACLSELLKNGNVDSEILINVVEAIEGSKVIITSAKIQLKKINF